MDRKEIIKWARHCTSDAKCEGCPYDEGHGCRDALLNDLATALENSISKADFEVALETIKRNEHDSRMTTEQGLIWDAIKKANEVKDKRTNMFYDLTFKHNEYFLTYTGLLYTAKEVAQNYEKETGNIAVDYDVIKKWFEEWTLCIIPKASITYPMLIKMGKKVEAVRLYKENENCTLSEANDAIKHIESVWLK